MWFNPVLRRIRGNESVKIYANFKQLLDEVFVISGIIEVEVGVISRSRRLRLITVIETSIILYYTLHGRN